MPADAFELGQVVVLEVPPPQGLALADTSKTAGPPAELPHYAIARLLAVIAGPDAAGPAAR